MNYQQTINHLYAQLPMFSRIGAAAYKKDLHNTIALCKAIGDPQKRFKSIHIAGTNGKGSTSHMLAAILQQAGYKTGLYTSPHLKDFRERIKVDGEMIRKEFVVDFVESTKALTDEIQPSFFELTVAMAFDYFEKEKVDIAVVETGLGGRLDSTNIITPVLSVITNIGYDHMNILGNTLEEIAAEKAGIIKPGVPVVIGEYLPETKSIFLNKAKEVNAPIHFVQDEYKATGIQYAADFLSLDVTHTTHNTTGHFRSDLNGIYQAKNICTALCAADILRTKAFILTKPGEKTALANVKRLTGLHGRWEVIAKDPTVVIDVAHNEDGMKQVLGQLSLVCPDAGSYHFILGLVKDKDVEKLLSLLPKNAHYYFTNAHIPRALPHTELRQKARAHQLTGDGFDDVNAAIAYARQQAAHTDTIVVCGSVFLVGEVAY